MGGVFYFKINSKTLAHVVQMIYICSVVNHLILFIMNAFLITSENGTSEWKSNFSSVQEEMNNLEIIGIVSNVKVQKFENNRLVKEFTYNYNGEQWEKN